MNNLRKIITHDFGTKNISEIKEFDGSYFFHVLISGNKKVRINSKYEVKQIENFNNSVKISIEAEKIIMDFYAENF